MGGMVTAQSVRCTEESQCRYISKYCPDGLTRLLRQSYDAWYGVLWRVVGRIGCCAVSGGPMASLAGRVGLAPQAVPAKTHSLTALYGEASECMIGPGGGSTIWEIYLDATHPRQPFISRLHGPPLSTAAQHGSSRCRRWSIGQLHLQLVAPRPHRLGLRLLSSPGCCAQCLEAAAAQEAK